MFDLRAVMPAATAELYSVLTNEPRLHDFYLIGGAALALYLGHRLSEDLDFMTKAAKLPLERIEEIVQKLRNSGQGSRAK